LLAAQFSFAGDLREIPPVFSGQAFGGFDSGAAEADFSFLDQVPVPDAGDKDGRKADFSGIPDYSFAYLNDIVVNAVNASVKSFDGVIYSITMKNIPDALIAAKNRGVRVRLLIDHNHLYPKMDGNIKRMIEAGINIRASKGTSAWGVNHNKITIHDGELVTVGSYNWTAGATFSNHENMIAARHPIYVDGYRKYFEWMWTQARELSAGPSQTLPEGYYGAPPQDASPVMNLNGTPAPAYLFSPGSDTENRIASLMDAARNSIEAVTFTFSSRPIAEALVRAHQRGVKVKFLEDIKMSKDSKMARQIYTAGVPFRWMGGRNERGAMHNKFMIFDGKILGTGSFNFTGNASVNSFENVIFINDKTAVEAYRSTFNYFYSQAAAPSSEADFEEEDRF